MKIGTRRLVGISALVCAVLLTTGCAIQREVETRNRTGINAAQQLLLLQDLDRNGIPDQLERVQKASICRAENCSVLVSTSGKVTPTSPSGFDCGLALDADVLAITAPVRWLTWLLKPPEGSATDFRFRPAVPSQRVPHGVYPYPVESERFLAVVEAQPARFVLGTRARALQAYAYGVYVDWKPKGSPDADWKACNPLDPIIMDIP